MSQVTIHQAQTQLSRLIRKVLAGEEVVIAKGKVPLVKLVAVRNGKAQRKIGADKGLIEIAEDFDAPLDDFKEYMV
ncbi:MAG: type II toxin-antitoxin system Phd/YefM family antitoxin [candidate division KSB1 bacterium]|nr:type II toxin-antitoxin system Phd/YefM family antitoxin [candidate division KSB1 bacterium]MDZ7368454.1 type II toxin-antitoxin system Phd/YefM family antitoxin [candidate division KSB1 bacterium]MDZ7406180.1 type II toxin-antitoxin system Phd/YefM family antitoxin [candidate division KSB1 bacterium]